MVTSLRLWLSAPRPLVRWRAALTPLLLHATPFRCASDHLAPRIHSLCDSVSLLRAPGPIFCASLSPRSKHPPRLWPSCSARPFPVRLRLLAPRTRLHLLCVSVTTLHAPAIYTTASAHHPQHCPPRHVEQLWIVRRHVPPRRLRLPMSTLEEHGRFWHARVRRCRQGHRGA